jgi:hypothetical protein
MNAFAGRFVGGRGSRSPHAARQGRRSGTNYRETGFSEKPAGHVARSGIRDPLREAMRSESTRLAHSREKKWSSADGGMEPFAGNPATRLAATGDAKSLISFQGCRRKEGQPGRSRLLCLRIFEG